jgi:hypothetical protein
LRIGDNVPDAMAKPGSDRSVKSICERMAIERIDFDAEDFAAENLAKGVEAAIAL